MENKEEIVIWLNNNTEKQESEIKSFLLSKMQAAGQKEPWQKDYFIKDLKRIYKDCPASILKIIDDLEKENKEQMKKEDKKRRRWGGYITAGLIFAGAESFRKTSLGGLIVLVVAIGAGFFYYRLKSKIKIKNEIVKSILTFLILFVISGFLVGFLTSLINRVTQ